MKKEGKKGRKEERKEYRMESKREMEEIVLWTTEESTSIGK